MGVNSVKRSVGDLVGCKNCTPRDRESLVLVVLVGCLVLKQGVAGTFESSHLSCQCHTQSIATLDGTAVSSFVVRQNTYIRLHVALLLSRNLPASKVEPSRERLEVDVACQKCSALLLGWCSSPSVSPLLVVAVAGAAEPLRLSIVYTLYHVFFSSTYLCSP